MTNKTIKSRLDTLEAQAPPEGDHDFKHFIAWGENNRIVNRYYKDGTEITAGQYRRENPPRPGEPIKVNINWSEVDHDQDYRE